MAVNETAVAMAASESDTQETLTDVQSWVEAAGVVAAVA